MYTQGDDTSKNYVTLVLDVAVTGKCRNEVALRWRSSAVQWTAVAYRRLTPLGNLQRSIFVLYFLFFLYYEIRLLDLLRSYFLDVLCCSLFRRDNIIMSVYFLHVILHFID